MDTIITKPMELGYTPPDFIDREKYQRIFNRCEESLGYWEEIHDEGQNVEPDTDPYTLYFLSEDAVRALMDKPSKRNVPIWEKTLLTLEEAAAYTGLGVNKIRELSNARGCPFVVKNGSKRMIKRELFDQYLEACMYV